MFDKLKNVAEDLAAKAEEAKTTGSDLAEAAADKVKEAAADKKDAPAADKPEPKPAAKPEAPKAEAPKAEAPKAEAPKAEASSGAQTYTVKSGDTLSAIGAKYGVSYQAIAKASGIDNPDLIFPGQVLTIPEK